MQIAMLFIHHIMLFLLELVIFKVVEAKQQMQPILLDYLINNYYNSARVKLRHGDRVVFHQTLPLPL